MELSTSSGLINSVVQKKGKKVEIGCCSFLVPFKPEALMSGLTEFCVAQMLSLEKQMPGRGRKCTSKILSTVESVPVRNAQREYESALVAGLEREYPFANPHPNSCEI